MRVIGRMWERYIGRMLAWACIAPHGGEVIPELAGVCPERMAITRSAMTELGRRCELQRPETVVVYTPHGICIEGRISVSIADVSVGYVDGENGMRIGMRFDVDVELAKVLSQLAAEAGIPIAEVGYREEGTPAPLFPMDWGVIVPMYFLGAQWPAAPRIVVACPDRDLPRKALVEFGRATVAAAARLGRRIAVVCSADQGHGHSSDGPYGFAPLSAPHDAAYCRAVSDDALHRLLSWRNDRIEGALTDSYWQTLMLYGALMTARLRPQLLSYEAPTYFGMACASFDPVA